MPHHPRVPRAAPVTPVAGIALLIALLLLALPALAGCGARAAAPPLRTGGSAEVCALDGASDHSPATTGFLVGHVRPTGDADVAEELDWVADETGTVLTVERTLATGALLLRAEDPLAGQPRVDLLCALDRLAAVRYAEPDAEVSTAGTAGTAGSVDLAQ